MYMNGAISKVHYINILHLLFRFYLERGWNRADNAIGRESVITVLVADIAGASVMFFARIGVIGIDGIGVR
jgi:hypothetical protein